MTGIKYQIEKQHENAVIIQTTEHCRLQQVLSTRRIQSRYTHEKED